MDSAALTAYLTAEWPEVIAETGIDVARIVGIVEEVYAADTSLADSWAQPLGDYYLLRRALRAWTPNMNVSTGGDTYNLRQQYQNVQALYAEASAKVVHLVEPEGEDVVLSMDLNFLTPGPGEVA